MVPVSHSQLSIGSYSHVKSDKYPHAFGNGERLPFTCGASKQDFPIQTDGTVYSGGDTTDVPDRVVFEFKVSGNTAVVSYCGVMRHGPRSDFLKC